MSKPIPDRWIPYNPCGSVIEGTRIICFKVPLRRVVQERVREIKEIWDIPTVLEKIPKLGAVIDITNTGRYYDPKDFLKANVMHRKIHVPGLVVPPENKVKEFMDAVDEFLGKDCDFLVGVHCTHGLNRTGYMVCRYLRDRLGMPAAEAIKRFETARGYKIERSNYVSDLLGVPLSEVDDRKEVLPVEDVDEDTNVQETYDQSFVDQSGYTIRYDNGHNTNYRNNYNRGRNNYNNYRGRSNYNNYRGRNNYNSENSGYYGHSSGYQNSSPRGRGYLRYANNRQNTNSNYGYPPERRNWRDREDSSSYRGNTSRSYYSRSHQKPFHGQREDY